MAPAVPGRAFHQHDPSASATDSMSRSLSDGLARLQNESRIPATTWRQWCNLLEMHPDDAVRLRVETGERVRVKSRHLSLEALLEVTDTMRPGVLCLPHGYGQNVPGTQLSTASKLDTVSFNDISDETDLDVPSATPALHSVAVTVEKLIAVT